MDKILLLDTNTANKIAAGEVVERPSSVVKELAENALDAGASSIEVQIEGGGIEYIRVTDNGSGMSESDAKLAVLRHATSKIRTEEDLLFVTTLGFRGEALPSIASVSKFTLLARLPEADLATKVSVKGGEETQILSAGASVGTSVIVEELFFNVPARRKFLRTVSTEGRYISDILAKMALARSDVKFSLTNGGRQVLQTPGTGSLADTAAGIYGSQIREQLLPVRYEKDGVEITGFVGKPSLLKSSRGWQSVIVNGRVIGSRIISRALDQAYSSQLPRGGYPFAVIDIKLDTTQIDVNVHPQKSEIRFSDEQAIFRAVYHALTDALQKPLDRQAETFAEPFVEQEIKRELPKPKCEELSFEPPAASGKPFAYKPQIFKHEPSRVSEDVQIYPGEGLRDFVQARAIIADDSVLQGSETSGQEYEEVIFPVGQIDKMYIIAQSDDTLYLIDQHAAHERILFDRLCAKQKDIPVQELLLPVYIELGADEVDLALAHKDVFGGLCFEIEAAGSDVLKLASAPADLDTGEIEGFIREALSFLTQMKRPDPAQMRKELIAMASCKAAIKGGQTLNMRQMRDLIRELMRTEHPFTCPHGRPVILQYSSAELGRMFKRT